MRVHYLQHVPFEGLGCMESLLVQSGHRLSATHLYRDHELPAVDAFDWLIVMGGPMGVGDEAQYSWMSKEKAFIEASINAGKIVLGICLGAQMIADVLKARVYPNSYREIGWFPLHGTEQAEGTILDGVLPSGLTVFHWHGDTFDIPNTGVPLASSDAFLNQGFIVNDRIVGLQFHLESTPESVEAILKNCEHELDGSRFVQVKEEILSRTSHCDGMNSVMATLLKRLEAQNAE